MLNGNGRRETYIGERLATPAVIANMRLFAGVRPRVDRQSTALDEALIAALYGAMIWSLVGVYAEMSAEIRLAIEGLRACVLGPVATRNQSTYLSALLPGAVEVAITTRGHNQRRNRRRTIDDNEWRGRWGTDRIE